jgi:hypothetical protein
LQKAATAKSGDPTRKKKGMEAAGDGPSERPNLNDFKDNPVKGAGSLLRLKRRDKVDAVLADADFTTGLTKLAADAMTASKAAVALSQFALRAEFSGAAATAMAAAGTWPEPQKFTAEHRRKAADALERLRPSWSLPWLANAMALAGDRFPDLRRFFASRLILVSGGLIGAVHALAKAQGGLKTKGHLSLIRELRDCARPAPGGETSSTFVEVTMNMMSSMSPKDAELKRELAQLLCDAASADRGLPLDEKFVGLVTSLDSDSGAKLREEAKLAVTEPRRDPGAKPDQETLIREAAWSDADVALGRALRDMGALDRSFERLESVADGEAADRARRAKNASNFVLQWVQQAAHKRSIKVLNSAGERVQFDPVYHDLGDDAAPGDYVRVVKPSIVRGDGAQQIVLLRAEVELE